MDFPIPLIHIGYHKTGSSFLQDNVFNKFNKVFSRVEQRAIYNNVIYPSPLVFQEKASIASEFIERQLKYASQNNLIPVFSNERLSGSPHSGGFDSKDISLRLRELFPSCKVLIVIREQKSLIHSCYNQYIKAIGSCSLKEYLEPSTSKNKDLFHWEFFEFHRLVNQYANLFGKENTLTLPIEMMYLDPSQFIKSILSFLELNDETTGLILEKIDFEKVNESPNAINISIKRRFNPFILEGHKNLGNTFNSSILSNFYKSIVYLSKRLPLDTINKNIISRRRTYIKNFVGSRYNLSNNKTSELIGVNLADYGYEIDPS